MEKNEGKERKSENERKRVKGEQKTRVKTKKNEVYVQQRATNRQKN